MMNQSIKIILIILVLGGSLLSGEDKARKTIVGEKAPPWSMKTSLGKFEFLKDYVAPKEQKLRNADQERKVVVLSFFASWCPPCTAEFQQLNQLRHDFSKDRVAIVALNLFEGFFPGNNEGRMKRFLKRTKPTFPVLSGLTDDELSKLFGGLERIPMVLIFDQQGRSIFSFVHAVGAKKMHAGYDELAAAIRAKLPAP